MPSECTRGTALSPGMTEAACAGGLGGGGRGLQLGMTGGGQDIEGNVCSSLSRKEVERSGHGELVLMSPRRIAAPSQLWREPTWAQGYFKTQERPGGKP